MIAMSLMHQNFPKPPLAPAAIPDSKRHDVASGPAVTVSTPFLPLDPAVLNASIPAFFIGRNKDGFWLARDVRGQSGGIFLLRGSALAFARRNSWPSGCATIFPSERFELDLENQGNPLIEYLRPLTRLAILALQRIAELIGKLVASSGRRPQ
jgi:hypothetical protein